MIEIPINQLSLMTTLFNFIICVIVAFIIRAFYIRYSHSLTGKNHISSVIPILSAVIFLVIVIVKSSLALSLGLVGALSIVRFRTPIKEPEELVYLFLAIAVGLGFGAGYVIITTLISMSILAIIFIALSRNHGYKNTDYNLMLDWTGDKATIDDLIHLISEFSDVIKLIRFETNENNNSAVMLITPNMKYTIGEIVKKLQSKNKDINITFFEAKTNW